jgi:hypothetical protein
MFCLVQRRETRYRKSPRVSKNHYICFHESTVSPHFMEPKISLQRSHQPSICPYPQS